MRTNIVGTNCACVIRCRSMSCRHASGSKRFMTTTVAPAALHPHAPPARCGVVQRCRAKVDGLLADLVPLHARTDLRGRVQRLEGNVVLHALRATGRAGGVEHEAALESLLVEAARGHPHDRVVERDVPPSTSSPNTNACSTPGARARSPDSCSAGRADTIRVVASQSFTMYAASSRVSRKFIGV